MRASVESRRRLWRCASFSSERFREKRCRAPVRRFRSTRERKVEEGMLCPTHLVTAHTEAVLG
ncbi:hypothetical protein GCM10007079_30580 [Nocardiopsis terrae]|nr:hypothetical protein GCM10007079_30580 [Nocardiopsis terrae]